jgi:6-phosphogluconolactonase
VALIEHLFESTNALNNEFANKIVKILSDGIAKNGRASLVVSGGRTPKPLFSILSKTGLEWDKVDITLADERWVEQTDPASNETMVRENLLVNKASKANFVGLKTQHDDANDAVQQCTENLQQIKTPFDVLILGMGEDGHTASLFPCSEQIEQGLNLNSKSSFIAVKPTTAPNQRMSLTLNALLNSENTFLHLTGESQRTVLAQALAGKDELEMPIRAMLNRTNVQLVWAP